MYREGRELVEGEDNVDEKAARTTKAVVAQW
jgi:hypothetical protein